MGSIPCGCCESSTSKTTEIHILSPKSRFSFFSFGPFSSRKVQNTEDELEYRVKLLKIIKSTKTLKIKVINDGSLPKGTAFIIRPSGLETSVRDKKDGFVYFGCSGRLSSGGLNDICVPISDLNVDLSEQIQSFMIYFNIDRNSYSIKDLGKGSGPYIKVKEPQVIKNNSMIGLGETYLTFFIQESHMGNSVLTVKKFSENESGNMKSFDACDVLHKSLTVGRKKVSDIWVDDFLVSKVQCVIRYDVNYGWVVSDQDSANGTWMYLKDEMEVYDGMIFKFKTNLFQVIFRKVKVSDY